MKGKTSSLTQRVQTSSHRDSLSVSCS